jgi:PAS domain S-box-containing protein
MTSLLLQILLVEDSEDDARLILREIGRGGYKVASERVETRSTMEEALARQAWDLILCDYLLPRFGAMEAIAVLKESGLDIPLIIISGAIGEETAVAALKAGASDFLIKGSLARLIPAIQRELRDTEARRERKQAEEAVRQMEQRFRALTENAPDGIALLDEAGRFKFLSPSARKIFGYPQAEGIGINAAEQTHPDDLPALRSALHNLIQNPIRNVTLTYRFRGKDGIWLWIEATFTNLLTVQSVEAIVLNFRNITERKQAEEKIQQQLERLSALREFDQLIASTFDVQLSLNILVSRAVKLLNADAASVLLLRPVEYALKYSAGIGFRTNAVQGTIVKLGESFAGRVALERRIVQIRNVADDPENPLLTDYLKGEDFVSYHGAPLIAKGKVIGVLEVFSRSFVERSQDWLDFFNTLAGQAAIIIDNAQLFNDLQVSHVELALAYDATIEGWSRALDLRDKETEGHTQRVTELTMELARRIGFPGEELVQIQRGALLHDIGKLGVPDQILLKPSALTEAEWEIMKKHPVFAYEMLLPIRYLKSSAIDIPYSHHEKWDGTGYPRGLKGEQIPLAARVFAIADVWDAITSDRPYRPAWPKAKALQYMQGQSAKHFDPPLVEAFLKMIE